MAEQVVLISIDGCGRMGCRRRTRPDRRLAGRGTEHAMRPDGDAVGDAALPHAMFHSVPPERHGITTNTWSRRCDRSSGWPTC